MSAPSDPVMPAPWLHVCIDMQRVFAEPGDWHAPTLMDIVPRVLTLARARAGATALTRFVTPRNADEVAGTWRGYYEHWASVCTDRMPREMLDVVGPLRGCAPMERVFDKRTHSAFADGPFSDWLRSSGFRSLVLSGVETDVCVLATALDAIDRGYGVLIARDAVTSSSAEGHAATLEHVLPRFDQQLVIADAARIVAAWPAE